MYILCTYSDCINWKKKTGTIPEPTQTFPHVVTLYFFPTKVRCKYTYCKIKCNKLVGPTCGYYNINDIKGYF